MEINTLYFNSINTSSHLIILIERDDGTKKKQALETTTHLSGI